MADKKSFIINRRHMLQASAGLVVGTTLLLGGCGIPKDGDDKSQELNAFVRIGSDNLVTVIIKHVEFGQGVYTGLTTLVAEELDADWSQMRADSAPANKDLYKNLLMGAQGTGGSTAMANSFEQMRKAGAVARAMLLAAAREEWGVPVDEITISKGIISHSASKNSAKFGELADLAAKQKAPENPPLKARKDFLFIGKHVAKVDSQAKSNGTAQFTLDQYRPDMLTAVVAHPPQFGATVKSFNAKKTLAEKGVVDVKQIKEGIAVYAENTFVAIRARDLLEIQWDDSNAEKRSSAQLLKNFRDAASKTGQVVGTKGDVGAALSTGSRRFEAEYIFPYLAHAPMEPLDALFEQQDGKIDVWHGCQSQTSDHKAISETLKVDPDNVKIHTMLAGGSFGRRAQQDSAFAVEAAHVFDAIDRKRPVKTMWTREDDIKGGYYRPLVVHRLTGAMSPDGEVEAWDQSIAAQSLIEGTALAPLLKGNPDRTIAEGAAEPYYNIPNHRVSIHSMKAGVPVLWWRSVGHTHNGFAVECFIDQMLTGMNFDPVAGRVALLKNSPRDTAVLKRVADMANWGGSTAAGRARGVAVHKSFGTYIAQIAEVSIEGGRPKVHKVWAAVDCGMAVNPEIVSAQIEGGIGYGLGAALMNEITLGEGGYVEQSNFHDYLPLRITDMPEIDVSIVESSEPPTGVGEPGTPPIAPAVANALAALTGQTVNRLPIYNMA